MDMDCTQYNVIQSLPVKLRACVTSNDPPSLQLILKNNQLLSSKPLLYFDLCRSHYRGQTTSTVQTFQQLQNQTPALCFICEVYIQLIYFSQTISKYIIQSQHNKIISAKKKNSCNISAPANRIVQLHTFAIHYIFFYISLTLLTF